MERFRAHEKEFKKKRFSKKALLNMELGGSSDDGSSNDDSYSDDNRGSDYDDENNNDYDNDDVNSEDLEDTQSAKQRNIDFLQEVIEFVKGQIAKIEEDLESAKNKKIKGGTIKKQKEKVGSINYKLV
jgi:hypothetical protein